MNRKQKKALIAVAAVVLGMLLYPPFHVRWTEGRVFRTGYGWIFAAPSDMGTVDIGLLITQWVAVLIIGAIAYFLFKDSR